MANDMKLRVEIVKLKTELIEVLEELQQTKHENLGFRKELKKREIKIMELKEEIASLKAKK